MRTNSLLLAAALALAACDAQNAGEAAPAGGLGEVVSSFALADVNPASPLYGQEVSPSDFIGRVSAWYFGHST